MALPLHAEMSERIWYYCFRYYLRRDFCFFNLPYPGNVPTVV